MIALDSQLGIATVYSSIGFMNNKYVRQIYHRR